MGEISVESMSQYFDIEKEIVVIQNLSRVKYTYKSTPWQDGFDNSLIFSTQSLTENHLLKQFSSHLRHFVVPWEL